MSMRAGHRSCDPEVPGSKPGFAMNWLHAITLSEVAQRLACGAHNARSFGFWLCCLRALWSARSRLCRRPILFGSRPRPSSLHSNSLATLLHTFYFSIEDSCTCTDSSHGSPRGPLPLADELDHRR